MRFITFLSLFIAAMTGTALYLVSQQVQSAEARLRSLNADIVREEEAVHVLKAEWSYLNAPVRLKRLAAAQTDLRPMNGTQMVRIADLADRPPEPDVPDTKPLAEGAPAADDAAPVAAAPVVMAAAALPPLPKHKPVYHAPVAKAEPAPETIKLAVQEKPETGPAPRETKRQFNMLLADLTGE